jgi:hypothetical protein
MQQLDQLPAGLGSFIPIQSRHPGSDNGDYAWQSALSDFEEMRSRIQAQRQSFAIAQHV